MNITETFSIANMYSLPVELIELIGEFVSPRYKKEDLVCFPKRPETEFIVSQVEEYMFYQRLMIKTPKWEITAWSYTVVPFHKIWYQGQPVIYNGVSGEVSTVLSTKDGIQKVMFHSFKDGTKTPVYSDELEFEYRITNELLRRMLQLDVDRMP